MRKSHRIVLISALLALLLCLPAAAACRRGDLNGDGRFSALDALLALKSCFTGAFNARCDMNGDGKVTLADVVTILKYAAAGDDFTQNTLLCAPTKDGIYNYCPSVLEEADGTRYLYYCTNRNPYEIIDYIGCRRGTPNEDGSYTYGEETIVLEPTAGTWDAHHTCDPSVVKGDFTYKGQSYRYLMAYLGCTSYDNQDNEIGFAVANDPMGPFVKIADTPTIPYVRKGDAWQWGVGQASLVSVRRAELYHRILPRGIFCGERRDQCALERAGAHRTRRDRLCPQPQCRACARCLRLAAGREQSDRVLHRRGQGGKCALVLPSVRIHHSEIREAVSCRLLLRALFRIRNKKDAFASFFTASIPLTASVPSSAEAFSSFSPQKSRICRSSYPGRNIPRAHRS